MVVTLAALLSFCAAAISAKAGEPWVGSVGLGLLALHTAFAARYASRLHRTNWLRSFLLLLVLTLAVPANFIFTNEHQFAAVADYWNRYCALLASLMAMIVVPAAHPVVSRNLPPRWRVPQLAIALCATALWLGVAYAANLPIAFYLAILSGCILLLLAKKWFRLSWAPIQVINTTLLIGIGLPLADALRSRFLWQDAAALQAARPAPKYWTYRAATENPTGFVRWWARLSGSMQEMINALVVYDRNTRAAQGLRPGARATFVHCPIAINSKGFRGPEIAPSKGDTFRIVALGESTTFGWTTEPDQKPWPQLLEDEIREKFKPARPVEVINAGVPTITIRENLARVKTEILSLKPDMIISYHGANGFFLLDTNVLSMRGKQAPVFHPRPIRLLAECEYRLKLESYRRARAGSPVALDFSRVMETDCARDYRELIEVARGNGIRLVLCNYSMAVNDQSPPEVVGFFREIMPSVHGMITVNKAHSLLLRRLAEQNPEVCLVDTQPQLDGDTEKFLDLMHFTPDGDRQIAENVFEGIRNFLSTAMGATVREHDDDVSGASVGAPPSSAAATNSHE